MPVMSAIVLAPDISNQRIRKRSLDSSSWGLLALVSSFSSSIISANPLSLYDLFQYLAGALCLCVVFPLRSFHLLLTLHPLWHVLPPPPLLLPTPLLRVAPVSVSHPSLHPRHDPLLVHFPSALHFPPLNSPLSNTLCMSCACVDTSQWPYEAPYISTNLPGHQPATIWSTIHLCKLTRTPASDRMNHYTSVQTYQDTSQRLYESVHICANLPGHQPATIWSTIHLCKLTRTPASDHMKHYTSLQTYFPFLKNGSRTESNHFVYPAWIFLHGKNIWFVISGWFITSGMIDHWG